jgi:hypothetical protein
MKIQLKSTLLFSVLISIFLSGCNHHDCQGKATTIIGTNKEQVKVGTLKGTFTTNGGIVTSGITLMIVKPVGADSIYCTTTFTASEGTFLMLMYCSTTNMTGSWNITSGTGTYTRLRGSGNLVMTFPPDVPAGVLSVETMTGITMLNE